MTPPPSILQDPRHLPQGAGGLFAPQGKKRPRPARWGRGRSLCSCFGGCCQAISGSSGRSDLGGSSLRRCSLACSLGGSAVLLSDSGGGSSLRLSGSRSSLRGGSGGRRRAAAGSHADSQDQSSNGNSNILEFHMENLLTFEKTVSRKAVQVKPFRKKIF